MSKEYSKEELENLVQGRIAQEKELLGPESKDNKKDSQAPLDFEFVNKCFLRNEVGGSELYSHIYHNKFACNDTSEHWMAFVGPHWEVDKMNRRALGATEVVVQAYLDFLLAPVEEELAKYDMNDKDERAAAKPIIVKKKVIQARIDRIFSKAGRTALLDCAATNLTPLFLSPDQLDQNQLLLPCANGVYDLENDEFRDGHPEDYLTSCSPYNFEGLDAKAGKFAQYLFNSTGANQEDYDCLRRHIGYAITGLRKERMFMVLHGPHGQNGKGTLLNILNKILGSMAGSLQTEMLMQQRGGAKVGGPTPEILDLKGKHVVFASETEKNQKFANGLVKKWSGGDEMSGRGMNENFITRFDPTHTLIMICNNLPTAPADDEAFWSRIRVFNFPFSYQQKERCTESYHRVADPGLEKYVLENEGPGIIAWLIESYKMYQRDGLKLSPNVIKWSQDYRDREDNIQDFIDACCIADKDDPSTGNRTKAKDLYNRYKTWHEGNDSYRCLGAKDFSGIMELKGFKRIKSSGIWHYCYIKISLAKEALES
ncbi:MAG: putative DNA primase/helicase [Desulforhopalus sp.]|jgi:putative DNA primase/helicase